MGHCAIAACRTSQNHSRTHPSKQCAIRSQHEEDFDGDGLAPATTNHAAKIDLLCHSVAVKGNQLTKTQSLSVSCPTSGVIAGMRCRLYSGAPREPHVDRKLSALGITERKAWSGAGVMPELGGLEYLAGSRSNCRTNPRQMEVGVIPSMNFYERHHREAGNC